MVNRSSSPSSSSIHRPRLETCCFWNGSCSIHFLSESDRRKKETRRGMTFNVKRIIVKKRTVILIALMTLALGLIGTGFSTLYEQDVFILPENQETITSKVSYGFPLAWHGYSITEPNFPPPIMPGATYNPTYWFSLESLFWMVCSGLPSACL
jgi:hypothetical protein